MLQYTQEQVDVLYYDVLAHMEDNIGNLVGGWTNEKVL